MPIYIGIDSGSTSMKWCLQNGNDEPTFGRRTGSNPTISGLKDYVQQLDDLVSELETRNKFSAEDVVSVGMGIAGVDRTPEIQTLHQWLHYRFERLSGCWVGNDAMAALRQGAGRLEGLVLISGTGSICYGVGENGVARRAGGWGARLGDEGSGFWIGREAIRAVTRMHDGMIDYSPLHEHVMKWLGLDNPGQIIPWAYAPDATVFKQQVASLAPTVLSLAWEGEPVSHGIVKAATDELLDMALALAWQIYAPRNENPHAKPNLRMLRFPIVCAGGLFETDVSFYRLFESRLKRRAPGAFVIRLMEPACQGALELGREHPVGSETISDPATD